MSRGALCVAILNVRECDREAVARLIGNAGLSEMYGRQEAFQEEEYVG